jgi:NAD(P)-dependent dehydrogenase (short-subunit alcohol dehydrogenase family)
MEFDGRIAVVTGGASGIGAATAKMLVEFGARVVTWDLEGNADIKCDVSERDEVISAVAQTVAQVGTPTILVHCAGITGRSSIADLDVDSWDRVMAVNLRGSFLCLGAIAGEMIRAGVDEAAIVLLSSTAASLADPGMAAYAASKAGVAHLTEIAAVELGQYGIRVNAISPGATRTPLTERTLGSVAYRESVIRTTPLGQVGTPEHLANAIVNTLRMDWVTGQIIIADGGSFLVTPRGAERGHLSGDFKAGEAKQTKPR